MDNALIQSLTTQALDIGRNLVGALLLWFVGRWLINITTRMLSKGLKRGGMDSTLLQYITSAIAITLQVILIISILGLFGVETTSFAALLAAAGIAIGAAWSGLLANFAAGIFLVLFRPFEVGDFISAGGVTGTVREIGIFGTKINTPDNVLTIVGNNKIFADNIQNFSINPYRRVDLVAQLNNKTDHKEAIALLKQKISQIPNVLSDPATVVEILEFNLQGPVLAVRPFCSNDNYWQVYFDSNRTIREAFGEAGFPAPEQVYVVRNES